MDNLNVPLHPHVSNKKCSREQDQEAGPTQSRPNYKIILLEVKASHRMKSGIFQSGMKIQTEYSKTAGL